MNTSPMYWSVRRELWENRSIWIAPIAVASVFLFGFMISTIGLPHRMRGIEALDAAKQRNLVTEPYGMAAAMILLTGFIVGLFYCLDALYGERRDRSILFWKSMPVSDRTTVLSKAIIPLALLPLISFTIALVAQSIMLMMSTAVLAGSGVNPTALWTRLPLFTMTMVMFYGLTAHVLWFAPIYSWLLLVSAWARRAVLLWAVLPFFAIAMVEQVAFNSSHFASMLAYRFSGAMTEAFTVDPAETHLTALSQLDPGGFLTSPGLWGGLLFAALFLAAAVRLRRNREPI